MTKTAKRTRSTKTPKTGKPPGTTPAATKKRLQSLPDAVDIHRRVLSGLKAADLIEIANEDVITMAHLQTFLAAAMAVPPPKTRAQLDARQPADFSREYAGYMATAAQAFVAAVEEAAVAEDAGQEPPTELLQDTRRGLLTAVYDWRKREIAAQLRDGFRPVCDRCKDEILAEIEAEDAAAYRGADRD